MPTIFANSRISLAGAAAFLILSVLHGQQPPAVNPAANPGGAVTSVVTNFTSSAATQNLVIGSPTNVAGINALVASNFNFSAEQIRTLLMPTIATTPSARNIPLTLFETYASTPERDPKEIQAYNDQMKKIREILRRPKTSDRGVVLDAYNEVSRLTEFDFDGGISENIRNRVLAALQAKEEVRKIDEQIERLRKERGMKESEAGFNMSGNQPGGNKMLSSSGGNVGGASGSNNTTVAVPGINADPSVLGRMAQDLYRATRREEDRLRLAASIGVKEAEKVRQDVSARQDFRQFIGSLVTSQQYQQAVLAIDFYRKIYDDGDYPPELATSFNLSLEAVRQAQSELEAFRFKVANKEVAGASEKLLAAFSGCRNLPELLAVPREQKREVSLHLRKMGELESMLLGKDYEAAEQAIQEVRKNAQDFDFNKAMALINAGRQRSTFAVDLARMNYKQGKPEAAIQYMAAAMEAWPKNPEIARARAEMIDGSSSDQQAIEDFDRMYTEENWRGIFDDRLRMAVFIGKDPVRRPKMEAALKKVEAVEMAILKSKELSKAGNHAGAWEALVEGAKTWPDDKVLNRLLAEHTTHATEFIKALRTAEEHEKKQQYGPALAWYLQARTVNPTSDMVARGIERNAAGLMDAAAP